MKNKFKNKLNISMNLIKNNKNSIEKKSSKIINNKKSFDKSLKNTENPIKEKNIPKNIPKIIPKKTKFLSDLDVERSSTLLKNFFKNKR